MKKDLHDVHGARDQGQSKKGKIKLQTSLFILLILAAPVCALVTWHSPTPLL